MSFRLLVFVLGFLCLELAGSWLTSADEPAYDPGLVKTLVAESLKKGNPGRGAVMYAAPTSACLSCHKVGTNGGEVGPDLSQVGKKQKLAHIVESLFWPQRVVADEYKSIAVLNQDGQVVRGYRVREDGAVLVIRDSATGKTVTIKQEDIDAVQPVGSLMPVGLLSTMSLQDKHDLIAFLADLGKHEEISPVAIDALLSHSHGHHPESFAMLRAPLQPERWPSWQAKVNRDRIYDFYRKQARHFRDVKPRPQLLAEFPGLDGGKDGHWGNQSEPTWADGRWNETDLGTVLCGVFSGDGIRVTRGICLQVGSAGQQLSACFDPDTLTYQRVWSGGFVNFSTVRHGFMQGLRQAGETVNVKQESRDFLHAAKEKKYLGFYRYGDRVVFSYRVDGVEYLDAPQVVDGKFESVVAPRDQHPDRDHLSGGEAQWPETITVQGKLGTSSPYAVDTIPLPRENPWKALIYGSGHDFLSDGSAVLCTMQGDVWRASGLDTSLQKVRWQRIASGLFQPLGIVVHDDQIFVIGRDQMTRLHDLNNDGEADYYECFSQALETSASGHDFTCDLWRDAEGQFYTASGKQGVMRIAADGQTAEVLATGLRNSDGLGLDPDGLVTIPNSEGDWTPASMIAAVRPDGPILNRFPGASPDSRNLPFFGRPGGNLQQPPEVPMLYLPRGLDNSSGGQIYVDSDRWGPVKGQMVHLSFGAGRAFLLLRDEFDGWIQGAVIPIAGEFASGAHRGKFNPRDGQLYVSGMAGWGTYTTDDGCFQRVRYSGDEPQLPVGFHVHENGIRIDFLQPIDRALAENPESHFAQAWNYRYSGAYGSPEYSSRQLGLRGHDVLKLQSVTVLPDAKSLFLEIPNLQPVNQLHLLVKTGNEQEHDLFMSVNHMDKAFRDFPSYEPLDKVVLPHPMLSDLSRPVVSKRNPHNKAIADAQAITLTAAKNLMFDQTEIHLPAGKAVRLNFKNPDAVPHNWALLKPGTLKKVGEQCNRLISDPQAAAQQYIPPTSDILAYTDVVEPYASHTIYFRVPSEPGRYPYLCTFPGHWMVMNGVLVVE
jgi:putative heme-binding domain-containing protein|tara:strand:- start:881 stop:4027 length:3147 start_codon:yes stop_codon:yes gene_type:complete